MAYDFDQAYKDAITARDNFNKTYEKTPYTAAGTAISKGLDEFTKANAAFKSGDTMGGSAAVLRGMGAISAALTLGGGPAGAAFGLLLGAITGVIAAILEAMKPASESLIAKIEKLLDEQTLKETRELITGGIAAWNLEEGKIDGIKKTGRRFTMADLDRINFAHHYGQIAQAFSTLGDNKDSHSKQWLLLFDLNLIYAQRFWIEIELTALLVCKRGQELESEPRPLRELESPELQNRFYDMRKKVAELFRDRIKALYYYSRNEVAFHSLYRNSTLAAYTTGVGSYALQRNSIYHRVGVIDGPPMEDLGIGESVCFAIADSGTIFSVGSRPYTLYVGRPGGDWLPVSPDIFGAEVDQVAIAELENDKVLVVCLHGNGHKVSICNFDDRAGTEHESKYNGWTSGAWRWQTPGWVTYDMPNQMTVLSLAIDVHPPAWRLDAFALDAEGNGQFYDVHFPQGKSTAEVKGVPETIFGATWLSQVTFGVAPAPNRSEISPCTISRLGDNLWLQVGNRIRQRLNGKWDAWDVQPILGNDINVFQARFYADDTQVFATNKGLIMRFLDPNKNWTYGVFTDEKIDTLWFWKGVSLQALTSKELLIQVTEAAQQTF